MSKIAYACFACRVSFKRGDQAETATCPTCGGPLRPMGWSFHAPPKRDAEQWSKVQLLYAEGFRFNSSGEFGFQPLPERLRDVKEFVAANPDHPLRSAPPQPELRP
jgi:hypothetical protein